MEDAQRRVLAVAAVVPIAHLLAVLPIAVLLPALVEVVHPAVVASVAVVVHPAEASAVAAVVVPAVAAVVAVGVDNLQSFRQMCSSNIEYTNHYI